MNIESTSLQQIRVFPILRPDYNNAQLRDFRAWFLDNDEPLQRHFRALGPEDRGCDYFEFAVCQHDIECMNLHGDAA